MVQKRVEFRRYWLWMTLIVMWCCVILPITTQSAGDKRAPVPETAIADIIKDGMTLRRLKRHLQAVDHKWGFIDVRPECHMFYWLFLTTHPNGWQTRPLVVWLQGGPGAGSSGFGNFDMIGYLDTNGNKRKQTWLQEANLLFIDAPIGAGFSYTDRPTLYSTNIDEMSDDLLTFMKIFMSKNPHFQDTPVYVFGQSYGGKLATAFAEKVHLSQKTNDINFSLKVVALGNAWISPVDSTQHWPHLLYYMAHVDYNSVPELVSSVEEMRRLVDEGQWVDATAEWIDVQQKHFQHAPWLDIYNVMNFDLPDSWLAAHVNGSRSKRNINVPRSLQTPASSSMKNVNDLMNGPVRMYLIERGASDSIEFGGAKFNDLFIANMADFMTPVVTTVDTLLEHSQTKVVVYQGQLDVICNTAGSLTWINRLNSSKMAEYRAAPRFPAFYSPEGQVHIIARTSRYLDFYWIMNAGHAVAKDAADAGLWLLQHLIQEQSPTA